MQAVHHPHQLLLSGQHPNLFTNLHSPAAISAVHSHGGVRRVSVISASTKDPIPDPTSATAAFNDYQLLFSSQPAESINPVTLRAVEGALPAGFPIGTYYLIGPGMTSDGYGSTVNPLDGHGYLRAFRFQGSGTVTYAARYLETEAAREEREVGTGKWRFRRPGLFSMLKVHKAVTTYRSITKNVGNTTVLSWGGRLFCLWDGGHPYEIDPTTLATVGPADLVGTAEKRWSWGRDGRGQFTSTIAKHLPHGELKKCI
ncbi:hypothetical protein KSP39_PZI008354 [Platanthera zijinensis]|uniref:Uncharacterized protein n=1 Tax=Platanthera zijinensis TaxID=2320716 RepID=A0AAP0BNB6_9ASPA